MFDFESIDIRNLIPQKDPFVMIDKLIFADISSAVSQWKVTEEAIFVSENRLLSCAFLENMAQTCAAQLGFVDKYILHNDIVRIGLIGSVKNLEVLNVPRVNDVLTTRIEIVEQIADMKLVCATSFIKEVVAATAEMKIAVK